MAKKRQPSIKKTSAANAITAFIEQLDHPCSLDDALSWIIPRVKSGDELENIEDFACLYLELSREVFLREEETDDPEDLSLIVHPRRLYFQDAQFRIMPTLYERARGILFPGHRFIPFCPSGFMFRDAELRLVDGTPLPKRRHRILVKDAIIYHTLIGLPDFYAYMLADADVQADFDPAMITSGEAELELTVFDMSAVYATLPKGASMLCRVVDYENAIYQIEQEETGVLAFGGAQKWCEDLEDALLGVIASMEVFVEIPEQLALAFGLNGRALIENPPMHVGAFLQWSEDVKISTYHNRTLIWDVDADPHEELIEGGASFPIGTGTTDSLEDILSDISCAYRADDLEAHMRHALFQGKDLQSVLDHTQLFTRHGLLHEFPEQRQALTVFVDELWATTAAAYNQFADQQRGKVRARLLKLRDQQIAFIRSIDDAGKSPEDLPMEAIQVLAEAGAYISNSLELLNSDEPMSKKDLKDLNDILRFMESALPEMIAAVRGQLDQ